MTNEEGSTVESDTPKQPNKAIIAIIVIVLLAVATAAVVMLTGKKETPATSSTDTTSQQTTGSASTSSTTGGSYKDGSYSAAGSYQTPGGSEKITVKVTLANGVINSVDVERDPTTREAEEYQGKFISGYKELVVGKKIDEVRLNRVAGSSLTPGGFNRALDQIKSDAQA